ncbi:MAG: phosphoribosylglycinamide formyltransferase [Porphyromonadaceae bacterium]|nr:phosphoribosylglycinamide formyltransferase [Porphyromonadaceae bacterium]
MAKNIAIFASGSGSNAENIIKYFENSNVFNFPVIISNRKNAYVHERANRLNINSVTFSKSDFETGEAILEILRENRVDAIVLAGFLLKIPEILINAYPDKIINIHPALLPKYGGKGMYGDHVHRAVRASGDTESGITIHYVNKNYDEGNIIFQAKCNVESTDSYEDIANKVHALEYEHFPKVVEMVFGE